VSDWRQKAHSVFKGSYDGGGWTGKDAEMMQYMLSQTDPSINRPPPFKSSLLGEIVEGGAAINDRQKLVDGVRKMYNKNLLDGLEEMRSMYKERGHDDAYISSQIKSHQGFLQSYPFEENKWGQILKKAGLFEEVMK
jgi:hypothetical protein